MHQDVLRNHDWKFLADFHRNGISTNGSQLEEESDRLHEHTVVLIWIFFSSSFSNCIFVVSSCNRRLRRLQSHIVSINLDESCVWTVESGVVEWLATYVIKTSNILSHVFDVDRSLWCFETAQKLCCRCCCCCKHTETITEEPWRA